MTIVAPKHTLYDRTFANRMRMRAMSETIASAEVTMSGRSGKRSRQDGGGRGGGGGGGGAGGGKKSKYFQAVRTRFAATH